MMKEYYIYKITCLMDEWNGKFYIGKHYGDIHDNYTGSGKFIKEYFKEYGKVLDKTYVKEIIDYGDENNICDLERYYIRKYMESELCLNMICNSANQCKETKQKLSKSHKGKVSPNKGKTLSDEHRKHISEGQKGRVSPNKGKTFSDEHKRKMSEAAKRRWARNQ